jgi:hypothetical protein
VFAPPTFSRIAGKEDHRVVLRFYRGHEEDSILNNGFPSLKIEGEKVLLSGYQRKVSMSQSRLWVISLRTIR